MKKTRLLLRFTLFVALLATSISVYAAERFLMDFEFTAGEYTVDRGKAIISDKKHTWNKGIERSFLKLTCEQKKTGKIEKIYSTVDYFTGLSVTHQLVDNNVEITVVRSAVQPRLTEIRALPEGECKDLSPLVTTITKSYIFPAKNDTDESRPFDAATTFRVQMQSLGGTR